MLEDIKLQNFRSYAEAKFELSPNINIIVGPNASGKTNLLEAVLMLSKGKSYRAKDTELIQFDKNWSRLQTSLVDGSKREIKLSPLKTFVIAGKEYKRLPIDKTLPIVLFEPNHLQLLSGSPDRRRDYLDDLLEQTVTGYAKLRRHYARTLAQRNNLLKQININNNQIFPWDIKLSQLAGQIVRERVNLVNLLNKDLSSSYQALSGDRAVLEINYNNPWQPEVYETSLLKGLENDLEIDRIKGFTSLGPHREDFEVKINNHKSQLTASRGETRTIVLTLKIIELQFIETIREKKPILLLDDVFSELDKTRRQLLTSYLSASQIFITTTDLDKSIKNLGKNQTINLGAI